MDGLELEKKIWLKVVLQGSNVSATNRVVDLSNKSVVRWLIVLEFRKDAIYSDGIWYTVGKDANCEML